MSWDILLFNSNNIEEIENGNFPGFEKDDFINKVKNSIPEVSWKDSAWGNLDNKEASIEFNVGDEEEFGTVMLHVYGGYNAVNIITKLCKENNWQAYDISGEEYIDLDQPVTEGYEDFIEYRDFVISQTSSKKWWQFWK